MLDVSQLRALVGNPNAVATQQPSGAYRAERRPITDDELVAHLTGTLSIGTYVTYMDKARTIVFDDDTMNLPLIKAGQRAFKQRGFTAHIERSGGKGFHLWVVFDAMYPAADLKRLGEAVAAEVGFVGEMNPKQAVVTDVGSVIKLPGGIHAVTGNRSVMLPPFNGFVTHGNDALTAALDELPPVETKARAMSGFTDIFPCMQSIQEDPPGDGERHHCLFHFVTMLRRMGLAEQYVEMVGEQVAASCDPPYDEFQKELTTSETYPNGCNQLPPERRCPPDQCIQGRGPVRSGAVRFGAEGERVSLEIGKRDGDVIEVLHPDLAVGKVALKQRGRDAP